MSAKKTRQTQDHASPLPHEWTRVCHQIASTQTKARAEKTVKKKQ